MTIADLFAWLLKPTSDALSIEEAAALRAKAAAYAVEHAINRVQGAAKQEASTFVADGEQLFHAAEHEAASLATDASNEVQTVEKELNMSVPQPIIDALARFTAALSSGNSQSAADANTISTLNGKVTDLTNEVNSLTSANADLTQQLSDAKSQINDIETAVLAAAPPAPAA